MCQMIQAARLPVTLTSRVNQRQITRTVLRKKSSFQRSSQRLRMPRPDKASTGDCHSIPNLHDRIVCRTKFGIQRGLIFWLYGHSWIKCIPASGIRQLAGTLRFLIFDF